MTLKRGEEAGAIAIEFVIVLPVLILLLIAISEFGILFYDKAVITNASREGARAGIVFDSPTRISDTDIKEVVKNYCGVYLFSFGSGSSLDDDDILIDPPGDRTGLPAGTSLTVTVNYQYNFLVLPNLVTALTGGINLAATTIMRME